YIVFNFNTQPFGAETEEADEEKARAVRQAVAASIDRAAIAKDIYRDTFAPLYSAIPDAMVGATEPVKDMYLTSEDRKSTRLNSSHVSISYAVFCLKKKNESLTVTSV